MKAYRRQGKITIRNRVERNRVECKNVIQECEKYVGRIAKGTDKKI